MVGAPCNINIEQTVEARALQMNFASLRPIDFPIKTAQELMAQLHLPMNHFSVGTTILKGATQLACAPHDFQPSVPPSHMIHLLNQLIDVVERALEYSEASNENLVLLFYTLYYHLIAIYTRFAILGDTSDLERCLYLSDVLRHFCDPKDLFLLCRAVSLTLVGLRLWCQPSRVSPRRDAWLNDQSVSGLDISRNFLDFAESVISKANLSLDRPVEDAGLLGHRGEMIGDLNQVINYLDEALDSCNIRQQDLQLLADTLFIKGKALKVLYAFVDNVDNLDYSIHLFEIVPHISRPSIACDYYSLAMELCYSLHLRYQAKRYPADCDRIAEVGEELLSHGWWLSDTDRLNVCLLLFRNLRNCFEIGRAVEECEHSFQIYHQALPPSVALADEHRSVWRQIQIEVLLCRSMGGHKIQDLQEALNFFKEAANNPPDEVTSPLVVLFLASQFKVAIVSGDMEMVARLESVHTQRYFATWFNHSPFRTDTKIVLDHIIETLKQRFKESASVQLSAALLVSSLQERYHRFKRPRDLREALAFRSNPSFGPLGTYCNDIVLLRAATDDLDPVAMEQRLVNATELHWAEGHVCPSFARFTPKGRGTFPDFLRTHALPLKRMSDTSGSLSPTWRYIYNPSAADSDFQVAREKHLLALSESVDNPLQYRNTLTSLATLHFERMARYETIQDLEQGVDVLERYLDTLSDDDDSEFAWKERSRWARRFLELNLLGRDTPLAHGHPKLLLAHEYLRKIVVDEHNLQHYQRLITIADWFRFVPAVWQGSQIHVQSMADLALELLEQQCWSASNIRASVETRHKMRYLLGNMVVFMLFAGHKSRAIEILEEGQSLLWNQISSLRTPLDDLISVSPVLASRLRELSRTLERQLGFSSETESDSLGLSNWQVAEARDAILEDIRMLPSFESFLKPRTFEELKSVGADGPVVLLLSHASLCAAFIFLGEHYMELQLPISYTTVGELRSTLRASARTRGGEDEEPEEERDGDENVFYMKQATDAEEDYRSLRRRRNAETGMEHVLEVLWKQVAEPVLKKIMSNIPGDKGKRKEYERPILGNRQRIWWCCIGEFSFLPIHAAGIYRGSSTICVSDFFISSYTPTLGALINARKRPNPTDLRILAAIQPSPGNGWSSLPQVKAELHEVAQVVPPTSLIHLGDSEGLDFEGTHTTVRNVAEKLSEATVLHLACHGTQDVADPLRSGFILANGERLTIEELIKHHLPNAHTAILSACHTASNDAEQPDEAINLANAMLHIGFRNVLATKWPMHDSDGPTLARAVYHAIFEGVSQHVFSNPPISAELIVEPDSAATDASLVKHSIPCIPSFPSSYSSAGIIDAVARHLRVDKQLSAVRWATFVHVGV